MTTINALMYFSGKRCTFSTRRKIQPKDWDFKKQRPKPSYPFAKELSAYLDKISITVNAHYLELPLIGRSPSCEEFRAAVANMTGAAQKGYPTIIEVIQRQAAAASSPDNYNNLAAQARRFVRAKQRSSDLDAVNGEWFNDFQDFMSANQAPSYTAVMASHFKTVIRRAGISWPGKEAVLAAKRKGGKRKQDVGEKVALEFDELRRLHSGSLDNSKRDAARKMLYLACVTGLRVSDWHKYHLGGDIVEAHGRRFVRIVMQKTNLIAYPPLWPVCEEILKSMGGSMVPAFWQHIADDNKALRDRFRYYSLPMGKEMGFDRNVVLIKPDGPNKVQKKYALWEKLTSKRGRDTFVTRFENTGIQEGHLKLMTGHSPGNDPVRAYNTNDFKNYVPLMLPYLEEFEAGLVGGVRMSFIG